MRQIEARRRLLQKKGRKRIYLMTIISWSIRTSKKKTTVDIFRLTNHLPYLSESSCHSILNFPFYHLSHSFTFFEYDGLIVSLQYTFISTFHSLFYSLSKPDPQYHRKYLKNLHFATSTSTFQSSTSLSWIQTEPSLP